MKFGNKSNFYWFNFAKLQNDNIYSERTISEIALANAKVGDKIPYKDGFATVSKITKKTLFIEYCINSLGNSFADFLMFFYIKIGFFGKLSKINFNWIFFEIKLYYLYYKNLESFLDFELIPIIY